MNRGAWRATVYGVSRVRHELATKPPPPRCPHEHHLLEVIPLYVPSHHQLMLVCVTKSIWQKL